jgi:hypothetical protein
MAGILPVRRDKVEIGGEAFASKLAPTLDLCRLVDPLWERACSRMPRRGVSDQLKIFWKNAFMSAQDFSSAALL